MPLVRSWAEFALSRLNARSAKERERARYIFYLGYTSALRDVAPIIDDGDGIQAYLALVSEELRDAIDMVPRRRCPPEHS